MYRKSDEVAVFDTVILPAIRKAVSRGKFGSDAYLQYSAEVEERMGTPVFRSVRNIEICTMLFDDVTKNKLMVELIKLSNQVLDRCIAPPDIVVAVTFDNLDNFRGFSCFAKALAADDKRYSCRAEYVEKHVNRLFKV